MVNVLPPGLQTALSERRIIPFVGAGVSKGVQLKTGSAAFPSWIELLHCAADLLRDHGENRKEDVVRALLNDKPPDLLEAAKRAQQSVKPGDWSDFLYRQFAIDKEIVDDESLALARSLWRLGSKLLITTNYDNVLKWASPDDDVTKLHIENSYVLTKFIGGRNNQKTVWHLHGEIDHPHELILSPEGYETLYPRDKEDQAYTKYKAALESLRTVLASHRLLFIGFSFGDENFVKQLTWLREIFGGQAGPHYALVQESEHDAVRGKLKDVDVECVPYRDHGQPLLALLAEFAAIASKSTNITPVAAVEPVEAPGPIAKLISKIENENLFPDLAKMSIDSKGQGSSAKSYHVLLDLRFGQGQWKASGLTLEYSIVKAELMIYREKCNFDGERFGDNPRNPFFVPEPEKWRISGPTDNENKLAGSPIRNEVLCRLVPVQDSVISSVKFELMCHREHIRYNLLDGTTNDPLTITSNKEAVIAAFVNKSQWDEGNWLLLSKSTLAWGKEN